MKIIKSNKDIDFIFKNGEKINLPFFNIIRINNNDILGDVAFITGKKLGNAVWRNSSKRRLKQLYIDLYTLLDLKNYKVLFLAKKNLMENNYSDEISIIKEKWKNLKK